MGMAVNEAREEGLSPSVVDVGVGIRLENLVGVANRHDPVAFDHERHVILDGIDAHYGCMSEDDEAARCHLSPDAPLPPEKECRGASAGKYLPPAQVDRLFW